MAELREAAVVAHHDLKRIVDIRLAKLVLAAKLVRRRCEPEV